MSDMLALAAAVNRLAAAFETYNGSLQNGADTPQETPTPRRAAEPDPQEPAAEKPATRGRGRPRKEEAAPAEEDPAPPERSKAQESAPAKGEVTKEEVRAALRSLDDPQDAVEILKDLGAESLGKLDPKKYAKALKAVEDYKANQAAREDDDSPLDD